MEKVVEPKRKNDKTDKTHLSDKRNLKVALAGNPNSGKTTIFNSLTGLRQKVGNYPGVTVDKKTASLERSEDAGKIELTDLPGAYGLIAGSEDEMITSQVLLHHSHPDHPDVVIYVADAANLKRSLLFCSQIIDMGKPMTLVLNMSDLAEAKGIHTDAGKLSEKLGIPVVATNAKSKKNLDYLKTIINKSRLPKNRFFESDRKFPNRSQEVLVRHRKIEEIVDGSSTFEEATPSHTGKLDAILTHKIWGGLFFLGVLTLIFQAIFSWAEWPMSMIENGFLMLSDQLRVLLPPGQFTNLLLDGVLAGLSGVLIFIPQIALLFLFIAIMEESGYLARVSLIFDRIMNKFGLSGKSVIPLMSGFACAIPAIMSARTIGNWKERIITIMIVPLMSCSARLPVYTLLIALVIPDKNVLGVFNLQGITLMGMYLLGVFAAIGAALVMKKLVHLKEKGWFIMEMPEYQMPKLRNVFFIMYEKVRVFVWDAGRVIVAVAIVLWVLSSYGPGDNFEKIEDKYAQVPESESEIAAEKLENSYAGIIGKTIEPAIAPLGFDWKIGIALITSFAAREVFVGTMATLYSVADEEQSASIREKMSGAKDPETGEKIYTAATGISLMVFYAFAMQCMSTLAVVLRETKRWKWPLIQLGYMTALAYFCSLIAYQLLK